MKQSLLRTPEKVEEMRLQRAQAQQQAQEQQMSDKLQWRQCLRWQKMVQ